MEQNLFTLARNTDPITSHLASVGIQSDGTLETQLELVCEALQQFPGCTSYELSVKSNLDRHMVAKRLSVLVRQGRAVCCLESERRPCRITGKSALTWRAL